MKVRSPTEGCKVGEVAIEYLLQSMAGRQCPLSNKRSGQAMSGSSITGHNISPRIQSGTDAE